MGEETQEKVSKKMGVNRSIYVSIRAAEILKACKKSTKRSKSAIISMLVEKYGPNIARDPRLLL